MPVFNITYENHVEIRSSLHEAIQHLEAIRVYPYLDVFGLGDEDAARGCGAM